MPEWRIGPWKINVGRNTEGNLSASSLQWQEKNAGLMAEALNDPEISAKQVQCPFGCGWFTVGVAEKGLPDVAYANAMLDTTAHIHYDCKLAPAQEKAKLRPSSRPSH